MWILLIHQNNNKISHSNFEQSLNLHFSKRYHFQLINPLNLLYFLLTKNQKISFSLLRSHIDVMMIGRE
jgi:hypothetical protein